MQWDRVVFKEEAKYPFEILSNIFNVIQELASHYTSNKIHSTVHVDHNISAASTVDHNISAARKFRESAPMYIFVTQYFRECAGTSTKKKTNKKRIMYKEVAVIIMRDLLWKRFR